MPSVPSLPGDKITKQRELIGKLRVAGAGLATAVEMHLSVYAESDEDLAMALAAYRKSVGA